MNRKIDSCRDSSGCVDLEKLEEYKEKGEVVGGSYTKAWYNIDGTRFLYKQYENDLLAFGEVLYSEASRQANVNCARYDFCKLGEQKGVVTYDFLSKDEAYYTMLELCSEFSNNKFSLEEIQKDRELLAIYNSRYNNLESIKELLVELFELNLDDREKVEIELVKMFCLDTLFWHSDRNLWNHGVIVNEVSDKMRLAPIHDNSHVLWLENDKEYLKDVITALIGNGKIEGFNSNCSFGVSDENGSIDQLVKFYGKSNDKIRKVIENIICRFDVSIVDDINKRHQIDDVSLLWIKALLKYRQNSILKGLESVKINASEAMMPNFSFNKRK